MEPDVAPTVDIVLGGKARKLKYAFRAYRAMGVNPFDPESLKAYQDAPMDIERATLMIYAGLLHECPKCGCDEWIKGRKCAKCGSPELDIEAVEGWLDLPTYARILGEINKVTGAVQESAGADPNGVAA